VKIFIVYEDIPDDGLGSWQNLIKAFREKDAAEELCTLHRRNGENYHISEVDLIE
jgi:hypothetical protein